MFEELGGFDANLPIAFNDIDYCLRLRASGAPRRVHAARRDDPLRVQEPGPHDDIGEAPFFRSRWRSLMLSGDPYYNRESGPFRQQLPATDRGEMRAMGDIPARCSSESSTS